MNPAKKKYLDRIRSDSAYPAFRKAVNVITLLLYTIGAMCLLGAAIVWVSIMTKQLEGSHASAIVVGLLLGVFYLVLGKVFREVSLMLVDVADSITDLNSRYEQ